MIKKLLSSEIFSIGLIIFFCILIIGIWFRDGKLLATGEEGLMLINPIRNIELYKYSWNETGLGGAGPGSNAMIPFYYLEFHILNAGVPIWLFQAVIFFLLMSIGACSIYYLSKELFKNLVEDNIKVKLALIAAIFYILNPVSLLGVWYRFLLGFIFFYSLAPLFFYLYVVGLKYNKKFFIIITPLITLLFSFAFTNPASILTLWFLPAIYSLSLSWPKRYPLIYFSLMFIFWMLINLWWLFPYIELSAIAFSSETSPIHAIGTLKANSKDFSLDNVIRLIHRGFLYRGEAFGSIYETPFFLLLSWLIPVITIYGLIKLKGGQVKIFFVSGLILLLFLVKGISPPFGEVFLWFFNKIAFLQVYRNPLEKIGMLLPIIYAPLFSFGLFYIALKIQNFKKRTVFLISSLLLLAIFHWPFFSGALASFGKRDIRVVVPSSFQSANQSIPPGSHIILSIPMMGGASGFYKWPYGYKGIESSAYLFNYPVINIFYDATSFSGQMLLAFSNGNLNNLVGLAELFSADIVVYRKYTDILAFGDNPNALERSEKMIGNSNLNKIFDSKELSLWTLSEENIVPVIYTPSSVKFGESPKDLISLLENNQFDPKQQVFICTNKDKCKPYLISQDPSQIRIEAIPEKIEFKKISPVNYDVKIINSKGKFLLVFNQTYHPGWTALVEGKPIDENKHIIANGYANGFLIDKVGSFNISLKFAPEEKILRSYQISLLAISLGMVVLLGFSVSKIKKIT